eukprot:9466111-Pyramimonas_sp.AAC.2
MCSALSSAWPSACVWLPLAKSRRRTAGRVASTGAIFTPAKYAWRRNSARATSPSTKSGSSRYLSRNAQDQSSYMQGGKQVMSEDWAPPKRRNIFIGNVLWCKSRVSWMRQSAAERSLNAKPRRLSVCLSGAIKSTQRAGWSMRSLTRRWKDASNCPMALSTIGCARPSPEVSERLHSLTDHQGTSQRVALQECRSQAAMQRVLFSMRICPSLFGTIVLVGVGLGHIGVARAVIHGGVHHRGQVEERSSCVMRHRRRVCAIKLRGSKVARLSAPAFPRGRCQAVAPLQQAELVPR